MRSRAVGPLVAWTFIAVYLGGAVIAHSRRFRAAGLSIVAGRPVTREALDPQCVARHPWDPGFCVMKRPEREAVEWLTGRFAPDERPTPFAADVALRLRMHYYTRVPWNRRREAHRALVYSNDAAYLRGWLAQPGWAAATPSAVLEGSDGASSPPDLLELCRTAPSSREFALRSLGLGGIDLRATISPSSTGRRIEAHALFISAGVSIEAVALIVSGADGSEVGHHYESRVGAFSREETQAFLLPGDGGPGPWRVKACLVDSEGFPFAVTALAAAP